MSHLVPLISDLAMILTLAGLATILCKKLNQPLILGYMLAGFLASPHFSLLPNVIDSDNITVWSDIGVIFILFDLGLDYNFNKIKSTANTAIIAAVTEFTGIACLGFACAQLLGWSLTDRAEPFKTGLCPHCFRYSGSGRYFRHYHDGSAFYCCRRRKRHFPAVHA